MSGYAGDTPIDIHLPAAPDFESSNVKSSGYTRYVSEDRKKTRSALGIIPGVVCWVARLAHWVDFVTLSHSHLIIGYHASRPPSINHIAVWDCDGDGKTLARRRSTCI
ncbi:hypothetical protein BofuT4_P124340.1 [Botrytis cinerea T4]|uniref:Uncharacterized protein n=1 Tax=Botryotinia fuckeliana (strain T4) TaxID=999810 RepID=G2YRY8_BOTF4|nr:hypothetical protein BofuT4_P124340.1 [Botrytis cinerea T4]